MNPDISEYLKQLEKAKYRDNEELQEELFDKQFTKMKAGEHSKKKITVDGVEYESIVDVCKVMGWSKNGLQVMMNRNKYKSQFKYKGHVIDR